MHLLHVNIYKLFLGIASTDYSSEWKEQRKFTLTSLRKFGFGKKQLVQKIIVSLLVDELLRYPL